MLGSQDLGCPLGWLAVPTTPLPDCAVGRSIAEQLFYAGARGAPKELAQAMLETIGYLFPGRAT